MTNTPPAAVSCHLCGNLVALKRKDTPKSPYVLDVHFNQLAECPRSRRVYNASEIRRIFMGKRQ